MIKLHTSKGETSVTFALPLEESPEPVSVVGDFNAWDPTATPLRKRSNGTRSAKVLIAPGTSARFKYLAEGGRWFNEPEAHDYEINEYGEVNSILVA